MWLERMELRAAARKQGKEGGGCCKAMDTVDTESFPGTSEHEPVPVEMSADVHGCFGTSPRTCPRTCPRTTSVDVSVEVHGRVHGRVHRIVKFVHHLRAFTQGRRSPRYALRVSYCVLCCYVYDCVLRPRDESLWMLLVFDGEPAVEERKNM